jgi:predicted dinucleotide-binding enzyme
MKPRISIIGEGNVGSAIKKGLERENYQVKSVNNKPDQVAKLAEWGEIIILAVPYPALDEVVKTIKNNITDKVVVDATNALTPNYNLALGFSTSGAEELQKKISTAKVVKAFNTVFAQHMSTGKINNDQLTVFAAGDDKQAKEKVLNIAKDIGFDAVDGGPLKNSRWLEALGYFNIQLGYTLEMGTQIGFKLCR